MRIWKFPLQVIDRQTVRMPVGAQVLSVQVQNGEPQLWALVDETMVMHDATGISIYGTGNPIPDDPGTYIATFQLMGGSLVFHAFKEPQP